MGNERYIAAAIVILIMLSVLFALDQHRRMRRDLHKIATEPESRELIRTITVTTAYCRFYYRLYREKSQYRIYEVGDNGIEYWISRAHDSAEHAMALLRVYWPAGSSRITVCDTFQLEKEIV